MYKKTLMQKTNTQRQIDAMKKIRFCILVVGIVLLSLTSYFTYDRVKFFLTAERAEGAIIGVGGVSSRPSEETTNRNSGKFKPSSSRYAPIISFTTKEGRNIEFQAAFSSNSNSYEYREKIDVLYLASDPTKARTNTFIELWFPMIVLFIFSLISILSGLPTKNK
jgi:hypothetical protein